MFTKAHQTINVASRSFQTAPGQNQPDRAIIYNGDIRQPWKSAYGFPMTAARLAAGQGLVLNCRADEIFTGLEQLNGLLQSPECLNRAYAMLERLAAATRKKLARRVEMFEQPISDAEVAGVLAEIETGLPNADEPTVATRLAEWLLPNYPTQEIAGLTRMLARLNSVMPALAKAKDSGFKGVVADQRRQSPGGLQVRQHLTLWSYLVVRSDGGQSAVWN